MYINVKFVTKNLSFNLLSSTRHKYLYLWNEYIGQKCGATQSRVRGGATQITLNAHQLTTFKSEKIRRYVLIYFSPKQKNSVPYMYFHWLVITIRMRWSGSQTKWTSRSLARDMKAKWPLSQLRLRASASPLPSVLAWKVPLSSSLLANRFVVVGHPSIFDFSFIFLGFYALIHLGFLNSSQTWFLFFYSYVSLSLIWNFWVLCCFGFEEMNFYLGYA